MGESPLEFAYPSEPEPPPPSRDRPDPWFTRIRIPHFHPDPDLDPSWKNTLFIRKISENKSTPGNKCKTNLLRTKKRKFRIMHKMHKIDKSTNLTRHGPCNFLWGGGQKFFSTLFFLYFANANASEASAVWAFAKLGVQGGGGRSPLVSLLVRGLGVKPPAGFEGAEPLAGSGAEPQEKFWKLGLVRPRKIEFPGPKRAKLNVFGNHGANTKQQGTKMQNDCQNKLENQHIIPYMRTAKVRSWQTFSKWEAIRIFSTLHPRKERKRAHCERLQTGADLDWPGRGKPLEIENFFAFSPIYQKIYFLSTSHSKNKIFQLLGELLKNFRKGTSKFKTLPMCVHFTTFRMKLCRWAERSDWLFENCPF